MFGSCWGLQVLTTAAGGGVRQNPKGREIGFGRGIRLTERRPQAIRCMSASPRCSTRRPCHLDEVETAGAQAARCSPPTPGLRRAGGRDEGTTARTAWGVQYHPEYALREMAAIVAPHRAAADRRGLLPRQRRSDRLFGQSRQRSNASPHDKRLSWRLGTQPQRCWTRTCAPREIANWIESAGAADARQARTGVTMDFGGRQRCRHGRDRRARPRRGGGADQAHSAVCHVSYLHEAEAQSFPYQQNVTLSIAVGRSRRRGPWSTKFYGGVGPKLWASIHLAGGFAAKAIVDADKANLMHQVDINFVACFLCCRARS